MWEKSNITLEWFHLIARADGNLLINGITETILLDGDTGDISDKVEGFVILYLKSRAIFNKQLDYDCAMLEIHVKLRLRCFLMYVTKENLLGQILEFVRFEDFWVTRYWRNWPSQFAF